MPELGYLRFKTFLRIIRAIRKVEEAPRFIPRESGSINVWDAVRPMQLYTDWSTETSGEYTATAHPLYFDPSDDKYKLTSETYAPYAVWAPVSSRNASTLVPTAKPVGAEDSIGWFVYRGRWELVCMAPEVQRIRFLVKGAVLSTATSFTVDNVTLVGPDGAAAPVASAATELTVYRDTAGYPISDNAKGKAELEPDGKWYAYVLDEDCP